MSDKLFDTIVTFPMPETDASVFVDAGSSEDNSRVKDAFESFTVKVNGKTIKPVVEVKALVGKADITEILTEFGLPIDNSDLARTLILKLPLPVIEKLIDKNALTAYAKLASPMSIESYLYGLNSTWQVQRRYYWKQKFPPGEDVVIEHEYVPTTGIRQGLGAVEQKRYCIDHTTQKAIEMIRLSNKKIML